MDLGLTDRAAIVTGASREPETAERLVEAVVAFPASGRASYVPGHTIQVDGECVKGLL